MKICFSSQEFLRIILRAQTVTIVIRVYVNMISHCPWSVAFIGLRTQVIVFMATLSMSNYFPICSVNVVRVSNMRFVSCNKR